ncbi:MAG: hypothetical protein ACRESZ_10185 [Methylococcales bacterium]
MMDGRPLTNTVGTVLDPVLSLRTRVRIAAGATAHVTFSTMVASSRESVEEMADKYHDVAAFDRVSALAWTHAQVQLHHLRIKPEEARLFQYLAKRLLYADPSLRPASEIMRLNQSSVAGLWRHRISGDRPIVLLRVIETEDRAIVEQLLRAHEYWTGNTGEFLGRNGDLSAPAGLRSPKALKNHFGAGLDPCAALVRELELQPGERAEIVFLLGQGNDRARTSWSSAIEPPGCKLRLRPCRICGNGS